MCIHKVMRKVIGILPISTKTCPLFQKQSEIDNKVHKILQATVYYFKIIITNQTKPNLITYIIYAETADMAWSVNEEISYHAYFSTIQAHCKKVLQKQVQIQFLKRHLVEALTPACISRRWAGLFLLERITQDPSTFQLGLPFQTKHAVLKSDWLEYETDVILCFLKYLLVVTSL